MSEVIDGLYFEKGFVVHVERAVNGWFYACAFGREIKDGKYNIRHCREGFGYGTPLSLNDKIENSGEYNRHYWKSISKMIEDIKRISGLKLIEKTYYK